MSHVTMLSSFIFSMKTCNHFICIVIHISLHTKTNRGDSFTNAKLGNPSPFLCFEHVASSSICYSKLVKYIYFGWTFNVPYLGMIKFAYIRRNYVNGHIMPLLMCLYMGCQNYATSYLKLCMFMDVFSPLSAEDEFCFISHTNQVVLHGVTQQPWGDGRHAPDHQKYCYLHF